MKRNFKHDFFEIARLFLISRGLVIVNITTDHLPRFAFAEGDNCRSYCLLAAAKGHPDALPTTK